MELAVILSVLLVILVVFALSSVKAGKAVEKAREERNLIYRSCFLKGLAGILARMAKADGVVTLDEVNLVGRMFRDMGLKNDDYRLCFDAFAAAKDSDAGIDFYVGLFAPYSSRESRVLIYEILWDIAAADGKFAAAEEKLLRDLAPAFELPPSLYDENLRRTAGRFREGSAAIASAGRKIDRILAE